MCFSVIGSKDRSLMKKENCMKPTISKKFAVLLLAMGCVAASASSLINYTIFTEPSFLFLSLLGLGMIALGRLRRA